MILFKFFHVTKNKIKVHKFSFSFKPGPQKFTVKVKNFI
jgi:hypothetical protein